MTDPNTDVNTKQMKEIDLGPEVSFKKFPAPISIEDNHYFLAQGKDNVYRLLSAICPHRWGRIVDWGTCFLCPDHAWRFEMTEGICINGPRAQMDAFPITVRDGHLFAELPVT